MASRAGEGLVTACSPALGVCVSIASPRRSACARRAYQCSTKKRTELSLDAGDCPCALRVCVERAARSGSSCTRTMQRQDNRDEVAAYDKARLTSTILLWTQIAGEPYPCKSHSFLRTNRRAEMYNGSFLVISAVGYVAKI